jgi:hypothetical protein
LYAAETEVSLEPEIPPPAEPPVQNVDQEFSALIQSLNPDAAEIVRSILDRVMDGKKMSNGDAKALGIAATILGYDISPIFRSKT